MSSPSALRGVPSQRSGGTSRSDRWLLEVRPWTVELLAGFDYIYDYPDRWECGHDAFLEGELDEPIRNRAGEEGISWARAEIAAAPERHAEAYDADRRTASRWRSLPEVAMPSGLEAFPKPSWDESVEFEGATWRGLVDGHPRLDFADGTHQRLHRETRAVGVADGALWALHDELLVAVGGLAAPWLDELGGFGLARWASVRLTGLQAGQGVWGCVSHDMPPHSELGRLFGRGQWLRLDPERGPVGRSSGRL